MCDAGMPVSGLWQTVCPQVAIAVVETYNTFVCVHSLLEHTDVTNHFLAEGFPAFDGALNIDITEFQTNLVLYPCIHFMLSSYAPAILAKKAYHEQLSVAEVSMSVVLPSSMYVKCDPREDLSGGCQHCFCNNCFMQICRHDVLPKLIMPDGQLLKVHGTLSDFV